jgi:peptidoglycan/LPS O-acetylase OafA/YrhL
MKHRRDIDGLRCIAIVPVVLCHAGADYFSGGFVGVDIFFVISGFLITSIILREIGRGAFTILGFYERRCRRILPALITVILCCVVIGYFTMLPGQYSDFAKSAIAALLFVSNGFFWRQAGYFAPVAEWMPLLHTWSLAVEEQYYVLFPIFMLLTRRWRVSRQLAVIGIVFGGSLAISVYGAYSRPAAAFYLTPFRAWELLLGVGIAYWPSLTVSSRWVREFASVAGLLMLLVPIMLYDERTPFPGLAAVPPCLGTGILLVTGQAGPSMVKSVLENRLVAHFAHRDHSFRMIVISRFGHRDRSGATLGFRG